MDADCKVLNLEVICCHLLLIDHRMFVIDLDDCIVGWTARWLGRRQDGWEDLFSLIEDLILGAIGTITPLFGTQPSTQDWY